MDGHAPVRWPAGSRTPIPSDSPGTFPAQSGDGSGAAVDAWQSPTRRPITFLAGGQDLTEQWSQAFGILHDVEGRDGVEQEREIDSERVVLLDPPPLFRRQSRHRRSAPGDEHRVGPLSLAHFVFGQKAVRDLPIPHPRLHLAPVAEVAKLVLVTSHQHPRMRHPRETLQSVHVVPGLAAVAFKTPNTSAPLQLLAAATLLPPSQRSLRSLPTPGYLAHASTDLDGEIAVHGQPARPAALRMKLECRHISSLEARTELDSSVACGRERHARIIRAHIQRMNEIHELPVRQPLQQGPGPSARCVGMNTVPPDVGNAQILHHGPLEHYDLSADDPQPLMSPKFMAFGHQQLHSEADSDQGFPGSRDLSKHAHKVQAPEHRHRVPERANPRQYDGRGLQ